MTKSTPHPSFTIYAVVLNWNRADDTLYCLESLANQQEVTPRLLVVDNGSTDDSVRLIQEKLAHVEVLVNQSNLGFGRGFNRGIRYAFDAGADYVFIANNDAYLESGALKTLLKYATQDVGLLAPAIYYHSDKTRIWSVGGKVSSILLEKKDEFQQQRDRGNWPEIIEQDFITGCGVLIPRWTYERVGVFDERFKMYYEDSDLCWRVKKAGLRILVVPAAKMWHKVSLSSGGSDSPNERYWMARSSVLFFRKHARRLQKPAVVLWRAGSAIRTSLRLITKRRWPSLTAYWRGLRDGFREPAHADFIP